MDSEKWVVRPGEQRVIDATGAYSLKVSLVGGQIDIVGHDGDDIRVEVHSVRGKDLRISVEDGRLEVDHPQLAWDNFLDVFRNFTSAGPKAEVSIAVPRRTPLILGAVSSEVLITGLEANARLNTVSGDLVVDGLTGDVDVNAVSGETQARGLDGSFSASSVSGDVTASGALRRADVTTVSGDIILDGSGPVDRISTNTVSGDLSLRLDEGRPVNLVLRTVSGAVQVDGVVVSSRRPYTHAASIGELSGSFTDVKTNSVSGDATLVRRLPAPEESATAPSSDTVSGTEFGA